MIRQSEASTETPRIDKPTWVGRTVGSVILHRIILSVRLLAVMGIGLLSFSVEFAQVKHPSKSKNNTPQTLTARQIAQRTAPSVVLLVTTDEGGNPIALGSGFFVANDRIVTNYHVIKDASQIFVRIAGRKRLYKISFPGLPDKQSDLALLSID